MANGNEKKSVVYSALHDGINQAGELVKLLDRENDKSHGLILSAGFNSEGVLSADCIMWGSEKDIQSYLLHLCKGSEDFGNIIAKVGIDLAFHRMQVAGQKNADKN